MWEPKPLATLRASVAYTGITLPFIFTLLRLLDFATHSSIQKGGG
jgi:hypothetical protein